MAMLAYCGFTLAINGVAAPWIMKSFGLGQPGLARLFAGISLSAIGAPALSRMIDRMGRRRILLWCTWLMAPSALGASLAFAQGWFVAFEIPLGALAAAAVTASMVMLAEALPTDGRAAGLGRAGIALGAGGGACIALMPLVARTALSWRLLLMTAAAGVLVMPLIAGTLSESGPWAEAGATPSAAGRARDLFGPLYRARSLTLLASALMSSVAITSAAAWRYFQAVSVVGLSPARASVVLLAAGAIATAGFLAGAWSSDRFGRVPTVAGFAALMAAGIAWSYWGPPAGCRFPAAWLGAGYCLFGFCSNAITVAGSAAATEQFPARLRATMGGWFVLIGALGQVGAQAAIAALAGPMAGIPAVVGWLGLLGLPVAMLFMLLVEETRGMPLATAAREDEWRRSLAPRS